MLIIIYIRLKLGADSMITKEAHENMKEIAAIEELGHETSKEYGISSFGEALLPLINSNDVIVVAGGFFGDEGKGKITDAVANHPEIKLIMRSNSGENAGHTVYNDGVKYVFHVVPSGILVSGKLNLIGSECVVDPVNLMKELSQLTERNKDYSKKLFIGNPHIVAPYHKLMDLIQAAANSSTLRGISPIHASKAKKRGLRLDDLYMPEDHQKRILEKDMRDYTGLMEALGKNQEQLLEFCEKVNLGGNVVIPEHVVGFLKADDKIKYMIDLFKKVVVDNSLFPKRTENRDLVDETLENKGKILVEAAQSFYLANKIKTHFRSATSADTTASGTVASANYNIAKYKTGVINVIKFVSSRVGRGENPVGFVIQTFFSDKGITTLNDLNGVCEDFDDVQRQFMDSIGENGILSPVMYKDKDGKEYPINVAMAIASSKHYGERGATTKKPRITGLIDCVAHHLVNKKQGPYLSISAMDRGDDLDKVGLVIAYIVYVPEGEKNPESEGKGYKTGDIIRPGDPMPNEQVLKYCISIIKVMDGWKDTPINAEKRKPDEQLPKSVQNYIDAVEHYTGAKVISIGNGQDSKNLIYIKERV